MKINRNELLKRFDEINWNYAPYDSKALKELTKQIAKTGHLKSLIKYSDLVVGVSFKLPNVNDGKQFQIDIHDWRDIDRQIIGDFLGYTAMISYKNTDFFASSLVIGKNWNQPSYNFFEWAYKLKVLPDLSDESIEIFWVGQVKKAHAWYESNPKGFDV